MAKLPTAVPNVRDFRRITIKQVDAFTDTPLMGNPAGVVLHAQGLTDQQMQSIAREMAVPETAFILPASKPGADLRIRWFSSEAEVPLCGHATIASFHAMAEEGLYDMAEPGTYAFQVETLSGILPVRVIKMVSHAEVFFGLPNPEFVRAGQYKLDLMRILNIRLEEFDPRLPIVMTSYLFVPVRRLHTIFAIKPNFFALAQLLTNRKLLGVCVFTTETIERKSSVHSRFFAPTIGINEDPVTGSANGPLGVYLYEQGLLDDKSTGDTITIIGEQGDVIGRKGRVIIQMTLRSKVVHQVMVGGRAVTTLEGEMIVP
ncbi:MAG: PhzF family phenazine biosynthesis protein [Ignavibacteria bacterium]